MANILDEILSHKRDIEVPQRKLTLPLAEMRRRAEERSEPTRDFAGALHHDRVALIAEVKRASPSRGIFVHDGWDPAAIARTYVDNGASAVSVLTDERFFRGHLDYLQEVRSAVPAPILRKDFIVDDYQLYEARAAGADAALLIVAALDDAELRAFFDLSAALSLAALVEVHDEQETERAIALGARIIGVNNRDLRTFKTDMQATARCARLLDFNRHTLVSESGIFTQADVAGVAAMGARAILVGEAVILAPDRAQQVRDLANVAVS
ncbi:MAG: indole-3-glycerol phosphate synthase TrpC [Chloroflexi bacterium]|nr:indole-3-glycerol phosphate synthase TrpC [Chloroflexota bacterium]